MSLAWYVDGLTPAQKSVLVALADHANDEGMHVYPSVELLCTKTCYAERTVRRALSDLRDMSLIHVVKEANYHFPTEYRLDLPEMQAMQFRPARDAGHDLPENTEDLPENTERPARGSPKPSYNHQEPSERKEAGNPFWQLPAPLDGSEAFIKAWSLWLSYTMNRKIAFTKEQAALTLDDLAKDGEKIATAAVIESVRKGWRNIHVSDEARNGQNRRAGKSSRVDTEGMIVGSGDEQFVVRNNRLERLEDART